MAGKSNKKADMVENKEKQRLFNIRSNLKKRRPKFRGIESWRYKRVPERWRRPRGIDSKAREKKKGWPKTPNIGYRSPKKVRNLSSGGKEEIEIFSTADLQLINPRTQVGRISAKVGRKKRERIVDESEILGIRIVNPMFKKIDLSGLEEEIEEVEDLSDEALQDLDLSDLDLDDSDTGDD